MTPVDPAIAINQLVARLLVVESAIDTIFSVAARSPELQRVLSDAFALQVEALEDALTGGSHPQAVETFQASCRRFEDALRPDPAARAP